MMFRIKIRTNFNCQKMGQPFSITIERHESVYNQTIEL